MTQTAIILGAKGRFGRAAVAAFAANGWSVRAAARGWSSPPSPEGVEPVVVDAVDAPALSAACDGAAVIVNAVAPPYPEWAETIPRLTESVIAAGRASGATVMIPGNVYNYGPLEPGAPMPGVLREDTPQRPNSRKGAIRVAMERAYAEAAAAGGPRTAILRAGDFFEREKTGGWFDTHMTNELDRGRVTYPGPLDKAHAWAYLPDLGRAMADLAAMRGTLSPFEAIGYPGYTLTGAELVAALSELCGRPLQVKRMPWLLLRVMSLVSPMMREVLEMRHLWNEAHQIDGARFRALLPDFAETPLIAALAEATGRPPPAAP